MVCFKTASKCHCNDNKYKDRIQEMCLSRYGLNNIEQIIITRVIDLNSNCI